MGWLGTVDGTRGMGRFSGVVVEAAVGEPLGGFRRRQGSMQLRLDTTEGSQ
jgi:hypothetical protein